MLTDIKVRKAQAKAKPYVVTDGEGLILEVRPTGRKYWRFRLWDGRQRKEIKITIGQYPEISLSEAREQAQLIRQGKLSKKNKRTFCEVAEEWLEVKQRGVHVSTHVESIEQRLKKYIYPAIGSIYIEDLLSSVVIDLLIRPIEALGRIETAHRCFGIVSQVCRYCVACGYVERDITSGISSALKPVTQHKHYAAITEEADIKKFLYGVQSLTSTITRKAIMFQIYTLVRPGELRHAEWSEINLSEQTWEIPAEKMKKRRPHVIPLSRQALQILQEIKPYSGERYIFPLVWQKDKPMSEVCVMHSIKRICAKVGLGEGAMTGHGIRAMGSTILNKKGFPKEYIEFSLAHDKDDVAAAYNRYNFLVERRKMLQEYSDYIESLI